MSSGFHALASHDVSLDNLSWKAWWSELGACPRVPGHGLCADISMLLQVIRAIVFILVN